MGRSINEEACFSLQCELEAFSFCLNSPKEVSRFENTKVSFCVDLSFQLLPTIAMKIKDAMQGNVVAYVLWSPCNDKVNCGVFLHSFDGNHKFMLMRNMPMLLQLDGNDSFGLREFSSLSRMVFDRGK